jgi:hypothetical protein
MAMGQVCNCWRELCKIKLSHWLNKPFRNHNYFTLYLWNDPLNDTRVFAFLAKCDGSVNGGQVIMLWGDSWLKQSAE